MARTPSDPQRLPPQLLAPRHWPAWLAVGLLWSIGRLPYRLAIRLGEGLGLLMYPFARRRRRIASINLKLCFPERSEAERRALLRRNFRYTGRTLVEMALSWWGREERLRGLRQVHHLEHLQDALARGRGVIMIGAHFTALEIAGRLLAMEVPFDSIYRPNDNAVFEYFTHKYRERHYGRAIPRDDVRGLIRSLKAGRVLWYPPDQDYGRRHSVFAPFFGIPAATITTTSRLAEISGAPVVPIFFYGRDDASGYDLVFEPPLQGFPSGDPVADATTLNRCFEAAIRRAPAQYLWVHRRFKTRPDRREPRFY